MKTFLKPLYIWLASIFVFFSLLFFSSNPVNEFESAILAIVFFVGVISFLAIFIKKAHFHKPFVFIQRKTNKRIFIALITLSILLLTFYWFQIRPSQIKISCQQKADKYFHKEFDRQDTDKDGLLDQDSVDSIDKVSKRIYERCLHRNGL